MTTANITLTPVTAATANAAAQVILNRVDTQICRLNNAWSGGWNTIEMTVFEIKATYAAVAQNIEFLSFIGVIETPDYEQLSTAIYKARRDAIDRRDTFFANKAHNKIRNDLAKSYKNSDC